MKNKKRNKALIIIVSISLALLLLTISLIVIFTFYKGNNNLFNAIGVAALLISFVSFLATLFFSTGIYQQSVIQSDINDKLLKKDDQYIIDNYSLFDIDKDFSCFTLIKGSEIDRAKSLKNYFIINNKCGENVVRFVFLPTDSINAPTYKVYCSAITFILKNGNRLTPSLPQGKSCVDTEYAANILQRKYNCICIDFLSDMSDISGILNELDHIQLELKIISIFNVEFLTKYTIYVDSKKDVSNNPDVEIYKDLSTYVIHHSSLLIKEKTISAED